MARGAGEWRHHARGLPIAPPSGNMGACTCRLYCLGKELDDRCFSIAAFRRRLPGAYADTGPGHAVDCIAEHESGQSVRFRFAGGHSGGHLLSRTGCRTWTVAIVDQCPRCLRRRAVRGGCLSGFSRLESVQLPVTAARGCGPRAHASSEYFPAGISDQSAQPKNGTVRVGVVSAVH